MATKAIQIRLDPQLKQEADLVFQDLGLDTPTAIRLFLKKVVMTQSIPFELKSARTVNGFTQAFEEEILHASQEVDHIGPYTSAKEAISALRK